MACCSSEIVRCQVLTRTVCCSVRAVAKDLHEGVAGGPGRADGEAETGRRARHLQQLGLREERVEVNCSQVAVTSLSSVACADAVISSYPVVRLAATLLCTRCDLVTTEQEQQLYM